MDKQTNLYILRPMPGADAPKGRAGTCPTHDVLRGRAISCITELSVSNGIGFELAYQLAVGVRCAPAKHPDNLTSAEEEALLDLNLVMQSWKGVGDLRPPQDHFEFLSVLQRIGCRASFMVGRLTRQGERITERYNAERERRAIRHQ